MDTATSVADEHIANENVVRRKEIKPNKEPHRTKDGNKQNGQITTLY